MYLQLQELCFYVYMFYFLKVKVGDIMDEVKEFLVFEEEEEVRFDIYLVE